MLGGTDDNELDQLNGCIFTVPIHCISVVLYGRDVSDLPVYATSTWRQEILFELALEIMSII